MEQHQCKKISFGKYHYRGFSLRNHGYYPPDQKTIWEAVNLETNCADFHATTKRDLKNQIDEYFNNNNKYL